MLQQTTSPSSQAGTVHLHFCARALTSTCAAAVPQVFMGQRAHSMFSARMGESTAAYQSPSKDLSFINSRLQGRHPFRATAAGPDAAAAGHAVVLQTLDPNSVRARTRGSLAPPAILLSLHGCLQRLPQLTAAHCSSPCCAPGSMQATRSS